MNFRMRLAISTIALTMYFANSIRSLIEVLDRVDDGLAGRVDPALDLLLEVLDESTTASRASLMIRTILSLISMNFSLIQSKALESQLPESLAASSFFFFASFSALSALSLIFLSLVLLLLLRRPRRSSFPCPLTSLRTLLASRSSSCRASSAPRPGLAPSARCDLTSDCAFARSPACSLVFGRPPVDLLLVLLLRLAEALVLGLPALGHLLAGPC